MIVVSKKELQYPEDGIVVRQTNAMLMTEIVLKHNTNRREYNGKPNTESELLIRTTEAEFAKDFEVGGIYELVLVNKVCKPSNLKL